MGRPNLDLPLTLPPGGLRDIPQGVKVKTAGKKFGGRARHGRVDAGHESLARRRSGEGGGGREGEVVMWRGGGRTHLLLALVV